jgi:hypothetical protein
MRALKTMSFAVSGLLGAGAKQNSERFVENSGLKHLFSALMKKVRICISSAEFIDIPIILFLTFV